MNASPDPALTAELLARLRDVPDFPKPGILFKDITPVLADPRLFGRVVNALSAPFRGQHVTKVRTSADKPQPACFFYRPDGSVQLERVTFAELAPTQLGDAPAARRTGPAFDR